MKTILLTLLTLLSTTAFADYDQFIEMQNQQNMLMNQSYQPMPTGDRFTDTRNNQVYQMRQSQQRLNDFSQQQEINYQRKFISPYDNE